jgi:glucokinase
VIIAADIGGTKIVLAAYTADNIPLRLISREEFSSAACTDFFDLLAAFADRNKDKGALVTAVAIGLAGPVTSRVVRLTNLSWSVDADQISDRLGCPVLLMNDLVAHTYGILYANDLEQRVLRGGVMIPGNIAIIAAGTGLGQAFAVRTDRGYVVSPTEGGHSDFAPVDADDVEFSSWLFRKYEGHVSAERVVSGIDGFENIVNYYLSTHLGAQDGELAQLAGHAECGSRLSQLAAAGNEDALAVMNLFFKYYGAEAGSLCLKTMATGGLYICGGIAAKNVDLLLSSPFFAAMNAKGRFSSLVEKIPVHLVTDPDSAVKGAAAFAARGQLL